MLYEVITPPGIVSFGKNSNNLSFCDQVIKAQDGAKAAFFSGITG